MNTYKNGTSKLPCPVLNFTSGLFTDMLMEIDSIRNEALGVIQISCKNLFHNQLKIRVVQLAQRLTLWTLTTFTASQVQSLASTL